MTKTFKDYLQEADPKELGSMNDKMKDVLSKVHAKDQEAKSNQSKSEPKARDRVYDKGYSDGLRGIIDRKASNAYGPEVGRYERGYADGQKASRKNEEIDRIKELSGITEETYDGDDFYNAYGDLWFNEDEVVDEAEYQGRKVKLGKPMRGDVKKFKVYVKNPKGNIVKVNFGDPDMKIKKSNPARRRSFRARHNCDNPGLRTKARYWSCRKW